MIMVEANEDTEAGVPPSEELLTAIGDYDGGSGAPPDDSGRAPADASGGPTPISLT